MARKLRENPTDAEKKLWSRIRMKQINGLQFYRQKPIGDYIVDFYCPKPKLVIEVDGGQHFSGENLVSDRIRDKYMLSIGLEVLRFNNVDVLKNIDVVLEKIQEELVNKIPLNPPFSKGEIQ